MSYSEVICEAHSLVNVDVDIPDEYIQDITYKHFNKLVRPLVEEANPKATGIQVTSLVGAKWREFRELYGIDGSGDTPEIPELDRIKGSTNESGSSDVDAKGSMVCTIDYIHQNLGYLNLCHILNFVCSKS